MPLTAQIASAEAPVVPHQFYGTVHINGALAAAGYNVVAKIGGVENASSLTDSQGRYGYTPTLMVTGSQGAAINFYVNGVQAAPQTVSFVSGDITSLNLTVTGTVPPPGSSGGTTINASILSNADTFTLSSGVLASSKTVSSSDGRVKLTFSASTSMNLQGQTTLGAANESSPPSASDGSILVNAYAFSPSAATFSPAATLTLAYDTLPSGVTESGLYIAYYDGSNWQKLTSSVNTSNKEVTASVSHFTIFAIRYTAPSDTTTTTTTTTTTDTTTQTTQTTTTTGTVSTSVLGSSGSFSVSNGVVASPASIASTNGNLSLSLASNTAINLQGSQNLTVIQLASTPTPPSGSKAISAYAFGPDNATFSPAATLTVKYDPTSLPSDVSESNLYIALLQNNSWSELNSTVNTSARTVSAQISHFSTYAVLGKTYTTPVTPVTQSGTGAFSTSDLAVSPASAKAGEIVTVSVRVVNSGTAEATKSVVLKINDQDEAQKNITLAPGGSKVVSFNVSKNEPGNYKVSVDGQSDIFQVTGGSGQSADMSMPVIIIIGVGGLLVIVLVIMLIARQRSSSGY